MKNPFLINVVKNGYPVSEPIAIDTVAIEIFKLLKLLDLKTVFIFYWNAYYVLTIKYPKITLCV